MMNKKVLANVLGASLLSVILLWILLRQVNLATIASSLGSISLTALAAAFIIYIISNIFRAYRFSIIANRRYSVKYFFDVTSVLNMMNVLLPSRMGELSYIYMLKKSGSKVTESIASLVLARIFDFLALSSIFLLTVIFIPKTSLIQHLMWLIAIFLFWVGFILIIFITYEHKFISVIKALAGKIGLADKKSVQLSFKKAKEILQTVHVVKSRRAVLQLLGYTYLIWASYYLISYLVLRSAGFTEPAVIFIVGLTLSVLSGIIPISGIAGFGTYEAYWAIIFIALGMDKESAIAFGFVNHIINLVYVVIVGIISFFSLNSSFHYFSRSEKSKKQKT